MIKRILTSLATIFLITQSSCDTTEPPNVKSPRDYTWTADTLSGPTSFQTLMSSIWGSSENDIYTCGHHSGGPKGGLWHYDGNEWKIIDLYEELGTYGGYTSVHGTSAQNVWVVGYKYSFDYKAEPFVVNYNGSKWIKHEIDAESAIYNVYVNGVNDVWICGSNGIVAHYDKIYFKWEVDTVKIEVGENEAYYLDNIIEVNGYTYTLGYKNKSGSPYIDHYFFIRENNKWELKDHYNTAEKAQFGYRLFSINKRIYSAGKEGVYKWDGNKWDIDILTNKPLSKVDYTSYNNIIMVSGAGSIYHFNGTNAFIFSTLENPDIIYSDVWMSEKKTFIIGWITNETPQKTLVIKGE